MKRSTSSIAVWKSRTLILKVSLLLGAFFFFGACNPSTKQPPKTDPKPATKEKMPVVEKTKPTPLKTTFIEVPTKKVVDDSCEVYRERSFEDHPGFAKVTVRDGGLELSETASFRSGDLTSVRIDISGCTHEVADITLRYAANISNDKAAVERALKDLPKIPFVGRGPLYVKEIVEAFEKGERDNDADNLIHHNATVSFESTVSDIGFTVSFRYDFPL